MSETTGWSAGAQAARGRAPARPDSPPPDPGVRFTHPEAKVWELLGQAASAYGALCNHDPVHPNEWNEVAVAFHDIQARLAARPMLRAHGWPAGPSTPMPTEEP